MVSSLLEGLRNRDHILDLNARLEEFPDTLHGLYSHMLNPVRQQPRYFAEASRYFQYMLSIRQDCNILFVSILSTTLAEWEYARQNGTEAQSAMTHKEVLSRCKDTGARIKSCCAGLLDVSPGLRRPEHVHPEFDWDCAYHYLKVAFLHQTVVDYINETQLKTEIATANPTFSATQALLRSFITQLKIYRGSAHAYLMLDYITDLAKIEEHRSGVSLTPLLDECNTIYLSIYLPLAPSAQTHHHPEESTSMKARTKNTSDAFLNFAISRGLLLYAQSKLGTHPHTFHAQNGTPLLLYAVDMENEESLASGVAG